MRHSEAGAWITNGRHAFPCLADEGGIMPHRITVFGNTAAILKKHSAQNHNGAFRLIVWDAPIKYTNVY